MPPISLFYLFSFTIFLIFFKKGSNKYLRLLFYFVITFLIMLASFHKVGISSYPLLKKYSLSPISTDLTIYLHFDKFIYGWLMIFIIGFQKVRPKPNNYSNMVLFCFAISFSLILIAMKMKYIKFDFKIDKNTHLFLFNQLFFTTFYEEIMFRRFIFGEFLKLSKGKFYIFAFIFSNTLFAISHLPNIPFAILAFVAGIFYTFIYNINKNILLPILLHLFVNTVHFIFFTYPFAKI